MRSDLHFIPYPYGELPLLQGYSVLALEGPVVTPADAVAGLVVLDGTWRYAATMLEALDKRIVLPRRSLPSQWRTAYPRRQLDCVDPERGLASVEALYIAYLLMGRSPEGILDQYHWRDDFLSLNADFSPS
jgi:pre-rRNA-processing protein TSR3